MNNNELNLREKSQQIVKHLQDTLGKMSSHDVSRIEEDIAALPRAVDDVSATRLIDELIEFKTIMEKAGKPLTDGDLLAKLKTKLSGETFLRVYESIEEDESVTFTTACKKVRTAIQTYQRINEISTSAKRKSDALQYSDNVAQNSINGEYFVTSMTPQFKKNTTQKKMPKCWNCDNMGHYASQCSTPFCCNCKKVFQSVNDPNYHKANQCPQSKPSFRSGHPQTSVKTNGRSNRQVH
jgi:hypothetical protein